MSGSAEVMISGRSELQYALAVIRRVRRLAGEIVVSRCFAISVARTYAAVTMTTARIIGAGIGTNPMKCAPPGRQAGGDSSHRCAICHFSECDLGEGA
jgi:hypothetical protein